MENKKTLEEYYGTQRPSFAGGAGRNHYAGADLGAHTKGSLGTRGADSKFSQRMQFGVPSDYYDLLEEEEEEIDEDVTVENSKYSLAETISLLEVDVIDLFPDPNDPSSFIESTAITKVSETATELGLELSTEGAETLFGKAMRHLRFLGEKIPGGEILLAARLLKQIKILSDTADELIAMYEKFENEVEKRDVREFLSDKENYIRRFTKGINEIERKQQIMYKAWGDTGRLATEIIPSEYIAGALGSAGGPVGTITAAVLVKLIEVAAAGLVGKVVEKSVTSFVESTEVDTAKSEEEFSQWLKRNDDPNSLVLKGIIFVYSIIEIPFKLMPFNGVRAWRGMFLGAYMQNILVSYVRKLKDPSMLDDREERFDANMSPIAAAQPEKQSSDFLRRLFFTDPGDKTRFSESLTNRSLVFLLEEKDDDQVDEEEEEVNEFSGAGAIGIGTLPLGMSTKSDSGQKSSHSGGKAYPYGSKTRKKFKRYASKTFGGK